MSWKVNNWEVEFKMCLEKKYEKIALPLQANPSLRSHPDQSLLGRVDGRVSVPARFVAWDFSLSTISITLVLCKMTRVSLVDYDIFIKPNLKSRWQVRKWWTCLNGSEQLCFWRSHFLFVIFCWEQFPVTSLFRVYSLATFVLFCLATIRIIFLVRDFSVTV